MPLCICAVCLYGLILVAKKHVSIYNVIHSAKTQNRKEKKNEDNKQPVKKIEIMQKY